MANHAAVGTRAIRQLACLKGGSLGRGYTGGARGAFQAGGGTGRGADIAPGAERARRCGSERAQDACVATPGAFILPDPVGTGDPWPSVVSSAGKWSC